MEILMSRKGNHLAPWDQLAEEDLQTLPFDKPLMVKVTKKRSLPHTRLYFACLRSMVKSGIDSTQAALHEATKMKSGLVAMCSLPDGSFMAFPDSVAFDKMDQDKFNEYFPKAVSFWKSSRLWNYIAPDIRAKLEEGDQLREGRE